MPITTILQHQRDREKLNQPDLGTPTAEEDHNIRNKDTIKEVRLFFGPLLWNDMLEYSTH